LISTACVLGAEITSTIVFLSIHFFEHGMIRPRFRSRAWAVLSRRGAIAGFTRLARVFLYSFDLLILGSLTTSQSLGPYAAARRVGFALLAIGLVVPSAMAPRFAKAWADGTAEARSMTALSTERVLMFILPAIIGLILTADRWMPTLFGEEFREGGPWLALIAAKLPLVIVSNLQQTALIACRRELWGLRLILAMSVAGLVLIPLLAAIHGIFGVAWGLLAIEAMGAISGWFLLARLGVAPRWQHASTPVLAGCVALILVCLSGHEWGLVSLVVASGATYGLVLASFRAGLPARIERVVPVAAGGRPS
jgi:O-antigen/teichoic acid export membrane protein